MKRATLISLLIVALLGVRHGHSRGSLEARGKVKLVTAGPDSDMFLGWFNSAAPGADPASRFVAIHVGGPTRIGHYFIPVYATAGGAKGKVDRGPVLTPGRTLEWSLIYDPSANNGDGEMRATLGAESVTLALKPGQKMEGADLDRFGLFTSTTGGQMVKIFLDDITYSAAAGAAGPPPRPQARILDGHAGSVLGLDFSPDGKWLASSSRDATILFRDAHTGAVSRTLKDHTADVYAVRFSPGGELLASCSGDKTIRLWDTRTFETQAVLEGHTDIVRAVAFSPDGKTLASVSLDQSVRLWNVATARLQKTLTGHTARVKSVVWSPDGETIATASTDRTIRLWDARTGETRAVLEGHAGDLETLAYSPEGRLLASSSGDTTVRLWDARAGNHLRTLAGHTAEVDSVAFSPDGRIVVSGSKDATIRAWDVATGEPLATLTGHTGRIESLAFSPDGGTLATGGGGGDTSVRLWDMTEYVKSSPRAAGAPERAIILHPGCEPLPFDLLGPFVGLGDGGVLAMGDTEVHLSHDDGRTWTARPIFPDATRFSANAERAALRTKSGVVVCAFSNAKETVFKWDQEHNQPLPGIRRPLYVVRSLDDGQTWEEPRLVQDSYCGATRHMIQLRSGRIILGSQEAVPDPGRHVTFTFASADDGATWKQSNVIDLGKSGGYGDHGGGIEATLAQLEDGRIWMLMRNPQPFFREAFSIDEGLTWTDVRPSKIEASPAPGLLLRLQSGRLALFWNRWIDRERKLGRREQLSFALSNDDGKTWTPPVIVARDPTKPGDTGPEHRLSYPYVYEHTPGELWITTMQGQLRIKLREADFVATPAGTSNHDEKK